MFPMIPGMPAYQASVLGSQKAFDGKGNSSKGAADLDIKFSSDFAKHSAIRILEAQCYSNSIRCQKLCKITADIPRGCESAPAFNL
ncbi:hypothetical protein [Endozoicomonas sp. SCSIO W0465]|uniref:hypothetical protein n=1 Tax=Endozoicomonas sp. SCSIO W0465 TaxID=2918516 RepID=UPI002075851C|nr:hypothetical protein [Endozoicomonas sp. SCSIO W0465]USE33779.1 hypothetical protein MJO57_16490 [Endozoicomonas sp. SCSIO W0465]